MQNYKVNPAPTTLWLASLEAPTKRVGAVGNFASRFIMNPRSDERGIVVRGKTRLLIF